MFFERCELGSDIWQDVDLETLQREVSAKDIDTMILFKATIRTHNAKYRRYFPTAHIDWAKVGQSLERR